MYLESLKLNIKKQLEYKSSFIMNSICQFFVFFTYYFMIIALFDRFNNIKGYNVYEVLVCFSLIHIGFSVNETFFRGMDKFETFILTGKLDRLLVRPKPIIFQVISDEMDIIKVFRILQGVIMLIIALTHLNIEWNILKVITLILMLIASICIFFGLFTLAASYCFITVQGLEVKNLMTDGGKQLSQYPINIYKRGLKDIFTYLIPFAFVNYYPLLFFLDKSNNILYMISPLIVVIFLVFCLLLFNLGLRHYNSTGS